MKLNFEQTTLTACFQLHNELLKNEFFAGYEGSKEQFDELYKQVYKIVAEELWEGAEVDHVIETFYLYQNEIVEGEREMDWYLYV